MGNGDNGYSGDGGQATDAELDYPTDIAVDAAGDLYIADDGNNVIREVGAVSHIISTVAGNGSNDGLWAAPDTQVTEPKPRRLRSKNRRRSRWTRPVISLSPTSGAAWSAKSTRPPTSSPRSRATEPMAYSGDGGLATNASLNLSNDIDGIAVDAAGDLFIADGADNVVREVFAATHIITTIAGNGISGFSGDGGAAIDASLGSPAGLAVDAGGDLFITDSSDGGSAKCLPAAA